MQLSSKYFNKVTVFLTWAAVVLFSFSCEEPSSDDQTTFRITLRVISSSITHTSIDLSWTKPQVDNFKEYQILVGTVPNFRTTQSAIYDSIDDIEETETFVAGLRPKTKYYFRVRVVTTDNKAFESNEVSVTTAPPPAESQIRFIHTASTLPSLTVTVDTISSDTVSFGGFTRYRTHKAGLHTIRLFNNTVTLDSATVRFDTTEKATVFILDKPRTTSPRFAILRERDMYEQATFSYNYLLRFVNTSIGLDTATLHIGRINRPPSYSGIRFGRASSYLQWVGDSLTFYVTRYRDTSAIGPPSVFYFSKNRRYTIVALDSVQNIKLNLYIDD